jgi:Phosphate transport (Pho88)
VCGWNEIEWNAIFLLLITLHCGESCRFAFIGYILILQAFLLYVRIRAKAENNRTLVKLSNPVTNMLQQQFQGAENTNAMVKNLASSFLSSESTVMEYDLKQAKGMQGGLIFTMGFMWLLHFKFQQVQPILVQTVSGLMNLFYSPLFQIYVMGRKLERPFKNPAIDRNRAGMPQQTDDSTNESEALETRIDDDDESESMAGDEDIEDNGSTDDEDDVDEVEGEE